MFNLVVKSRDQVVISRRFRWKGQNERVYEKVLGDVRQSNIHDKCTVLRDENEFNKGVDLTDSG